jgi:hypothetical protein
MKGMKGRSRRQGPRPTANIAYNQYLARLDIDTYNRPTHQRLSKSSMNERNNKQDKLTMSGKSNEQIQHQTSQECCTLCSHLC